MKFQRLLVSILTFSVLLLGNFLGCQRPGQMSMANQLAQNSTAPDFTLKDINGRPVSLSQFRGKAVILDFWATWCPPCRQEIPNLVDYYNKNKDKVAIIGIAVDDDGVKVVKPFVKEFKMTYPVVIADAKVQQAYGGIQGIPTKFFISKEGKIVKSSVGYLEIETVKKIIQPLL